MVYSSVEDEQLTLIVRFKAKKNNEAKTKLTEIQIEKPKLNCCGQTYVIRFSDNRKRNFYWDLTEVWTKKLKLVGTENRKAEKLAEIGMEYWNVQSFVLNINVAAQ